MLNKNSSARREMSTTPPPPLHFKCSRSAKASWSLKFTYLILQRSYKANVVTKYGNFITSSLMHNEELIPRLHTNI